MTGRAYGRIALIVVALTTIGCDRVTKHAATTMLAGTPGRSYLAGTVRLAYAENAGGFLSLGTSLPPVARTAFFTIANGLILFALIVFAVRRRFDGLPASGLALFVAGGASNWIDRITRGSVVDFLNVGIGPLRTGIFNVADVAIVIGAGLFALSWIESERDISVSSDTP